jgi:hypothetical protein
VKKMKAKSPKQTESEKLLETKQEEKPLLTEGRKHETKKEKIPLRIPGFRNMPVLMKLRLAVLTIFLLSTIAVLLIFIIDFIYPALLLIISYILLFVLVMKLFLTKRF